MLPFCMLLCDIRVENNQQIEVFLFYINEANKLGQRQLRLQATMNSENIFALTDRMEDCLFIPSKSTLISRLILCILATCSSPSKHQEFQLHSLFHNSFSMYTIVQFCKQAHMPTGTSPFHFALKPRFL